MALSWLDTAIIILFALQLVSGYTQGLLAGVVSLVGMALTLAAIMVLPGPAAIALKHWAPWPPVATAIGAAALAVILIRLGMLWVGSRLWLRLSAAPKQARIANHLLGVIPGAGWGLFTAGLAAWLGNLFLGGLPPHSPIASRVLGTSRPALEALADHVPTSLPAIALFPGGWAIVADAGAEPASVAPSTLEKQMLVLVNQERKKAGKPPLAWDGKLAVLARAESRAMLKENFFAHTDPHGRTPSGRMLGAGIPFLLMGENLAFAPNLAIAHRGLMESPGHRANILNEGFHHVGIGIVRIPSGAHYWPKFEGEGNAGNKPLRSDAGYLLVTQEFKN